MQHRAIRLMASKLAVAGIIEGNNFTDEGLAAMSDCADMTTALARELTHGIKDEVEDLSAVFKKMAKLKPEANLLQIVQELIEDTENIEKINPDTEVAPASATVLYAPFKQESIQKDTVLQKFRQFKEMFKSSSIPNSVLLEMVESLIKSDNGEDALRDNGNDFDPFAEEAA